MTHPNEARELEAKTGTPEQGSGNRTPDEGRPLTGPLPATTSTVTDPSPVPHTFGIGETINPMIHAGGDRQFVRLAPVDVEGLASALERIAPDAVLIQDRKALHEAAAALRVHDAERARLMRLLPMDTERMPGAREWDDVEWMRNQLALANEDFVESERKLVALEVRNSELAAELEGADTINEGLREKLAATSKLALPATGPFDLQAVLERVASHLEARRNSYGCSDSPTPCETCEAQSRDAATLRRIANDHSHARGGPT